MPNDSKQLSYLKRNAARSKDIFLLQPKQPYFTRHARSVGLNGIEISEPRFGGIEGIENVESMVEKEYVTHCEKCDVRANTTMVAVTAGLLPLKTHG